MDNTEIQDSDHSDTVSQNITKLYLSTFTLQKLRDDLLGYLNSAPNNSVRQEGQTFICFVTNIHTQEEEEIRFNTTDNVHIVRHSSVLKLGDFYFSVLVGLGAFIPDEECQGGYSVERGFALLEYNYDLSLYNVELYTDNVNTL